MYYSYNVFVLPPFQACSLYFFLFHTLYILRIIQDSYVCKYFCALVSLILQGATEPNQILLKGSIKYSDSDYEHVNNTHSTECQHRLCDCYYYAIIDGLNVSLAFGGCRFPQCINLLLFPLDGAPQQLLVLFLLLVKLTQQPEMQTQWVYSAESLGLKGSFVRLYGLNVEDGILNPAQ